MNYYDANQTPNNNNNNNNITDYTQITHIQITRTYLLKKFPLLFISVVSLLTASFAQMFPLLTAAKQDICLTPRSRNAL